MPIYNGDNMAQKQLVLVYEGYSEREAFALQKELINCQG